MAAAVGVNQCKVQKEKCKRSVRNSVSLNIFGDGLKLYNSSYIREKIYI